VDYWKYINPFVYLGTEAAGKVVADGWTVAMLGIWNGGLWLLKLALTLEEYFLTPDLRENGPMRTIYPYTFWIAGSLVVVLLMVQLGIAAFRRDGQSLARVLIGSAQFVMVWVGWVVYAFAVLAAAGGLTHALMKSLLKVDAMDAWQPWAGFSTEDITDGTLATVLGIMGFFLIFAAVGHLLVMLARGVSLIVLVATAPISAAGLVWEGGKSWFWKTFRWFHAAAFTPAIMMLILGLSVQLTSQIALGATDSLGGAIGSAVPGIMLILVSCVAPLALFKLLAFVDPGTSSGAAMRAGLAASGGVQGLLSGGGSGQSNAASTSDPSGSSQGEASSEAATSQRFAGAAGGAAGMFGGLGSAAAAGLGAFANAGGRAAAVGADLTNQMGVGHNTYIPDFASSRSRGGNNGGPSDRDNPEINGSGQDVGGDSPGSPMPSPPAPSMPSSSGLPGGGLPGGGGGAPSTGAGAAGGGGAAAGGAGAAAAVPIVPV
jgi:hypothetical protein